MKKLTIRDVTNAIKAYAFLSVWCDSTANRAKVGEHVTLQSNYIKIREIQDYVGTRLYNY